MNLSFKCEGRKRLFQQKSNLLSVDLSGKKCEEQFFKENALLGIK